VNEIYEYRTLHVRPRAWPEVSLAIHGRGRQKVERAGGRIFGLWLGQIGMAANEGVLITAWPSLDADARIPVSPVEGMTDVMESSAERLVATVRPAQPDPPLQSGVYAHRWFQLQECDWAEFLELSQGAWPAFEKAHDSQIMGFWRSLDAEPPLTRVLLLTRYPSLAIWERSRLPGDEGSAQAQAWQRFRRRHELTDWTRVATTTLAGPAG
jgi:hypothetical protein